MSKEPTKDHATLKSPSGLWAALFDLAREPLYWLLLALPLAVILDVVRMSGPWLFIASAVAIIPLAGLMGRATESLTLTLGPAIGGLLNATFGNAAELIIALFALARGPAMFPLVKASVTGSIIGNVLLVMGASIVAGGLYFPKQRFNRTTASMGATLLTLASVGLIMPAIFYHLFIGRAGPSQEELGRIESLSVEISGVLIFIYLLSLFFTLVTHRDLFSGDDSSPQVTAGGDAVWDWKFGLALLLTATGGVAWMSHLLVGTVEQARTALGLNEVFVGVIIVAIIGNAAEHSTAIQMAVRDQLDATAQIAVGSAIQVALFVAPILVFSSLLMGHSQPLDLHFSLLETITILISVVVLALACNDGETHWMEGALMLGVYVIIGLAFYNLPT